MILDKLVEKKDLLIYFEQRIISLKRTIGQPNDRLRDPAVSNSEKKRIMRGQGKLVGRLRELKTLRRVISSGTLKKKAKQHWIENYEAGDT